MYCNVNSLTVKITRIFKRVKTTNEGNFKVFSLMISVISLYLWSLYYVMNFKAVHNANDVCNVHDVYHVPMVNMTSMMTALFHDVSLYMILRSLSLGWPSSLWYDVIFQCIDIMIHMMLMMFNCSSCLLCPENFWYSIHIWWLWFLWFHDTLCVGNLRVWLQH